MCNQEYIPRVSAFFSRSWHFTVANYTKGSFRLKFGAAFEMASVQLGADVCSLKLVAVENICSGTVNHDYPACPPVINKINNINSCLIYPECVWSSKNDQMLNRKYPVIFLPEMPSPNNGCPSLLEMRQRLACLVLEELL